MPLTGNLADVTVPDLLQFVHLSGRSGTLFLEREGHEAHISFHRGGIASAWSPGAPNVVDLLLAGGGLTSAGLDKARAQQQSESPPPSLGQALVGTGACSPAALREAITRKVELAIYELVSWTRGHFRFVVDEVRGDNEVALAPGDVIPELDINTQMVLMEALRLFDERDRRPAEARPPSATPEAVPTDVTTAPVAVQIVTKDAALADALAECLRERAQVRRVRLLDAGLPAPGQQSPVVVLDTRGGAADLDALRRLRGQRPRAIYLVVGELSADATPFYETGAVASVPPVAGVVASVCSTLLGARGVQSSAPEVDLRSGLARLRRILGDLRSGLLSATMSLNLMTIVADSLERAVLFVVQRGQLVAVGAFGSREDGKPLATTTHGLAMPLSAESPFARCVADGRARVVGYGEPDLPPALMSVVDRPRANQAVLFPVMGTRRIIALIYADNGRRLRPIDDVELVEIATAQVGLAFENELLRRQLHQKPESAAR